MEPGFLGTEQVTEEDRAYRGSRFSEVRDAIFANPYQRVWGSAGEPALPIYGVRSPSALRGILPLGSPYFFGRPSQEPSIRAPICAGAAIARVSAE
jgi:hypothetical protein